VSQDKVKEAFQHKEAMRVAWSNALGARVEAQRELNATHDKAVDTAKSAFDAASLALEQAEAAATVDHPRDGERVFKMEPVYSYKWASRPTSFKRVDGVLATYRPGDSKPRWSSVGAGELIVLPILKSGKPGAKAMAFDDEWKSVEQVPA